jgi:hypothetical protein
MYFTVNQFLPGIWILNQVSLCYKGQSPLNDIMLGGTEGWFEALYKRITWTLSFLFVIYSWNKTGLKHGSKNDVTYT